ncbi:MAG: hypothetical protein DHS20C18_56040 [Saprospiraceae bacterium]|nr:MAG: hypothetical protein DHS20C18_56040 [Saprospiraceae bacterium]
MKNYSTLLLISFLLSFGWSQNGNAQCETDTEPPFLTCIVGLVGELDPGTGVVEIWPEDILAFLSDNCTSNDSIELRITLDGSTEIGPSILFDAPGTYSVSLIATDLMGNSQTCFTFVTIGNNVYNQITGNVFVDTDGNCSAGTGETPLESWPVVLRYDFQQGPNIINQELTTQTDEAGYYRFDIIQDLIPNIVQFELFLDANTSANGCPTSYTLTNEIFSETDSINYDLPVKLIEDCYALDVDIAASFLRRCFSSNYFVKVCNSGAETAEDASVSITLDNFLLYQNSSLPLSEVNGQTYTFDLGDLEGGACTQFTVQVDVSCDALFGQTHCTEAVASPKSPCQTSGLPQLMIEGDCDGSEVVFRITNIGEENMENYVGYTVVEDVIMYMSDSVKLDAGAWQEVMLNANGSTYHLQLEQPMPGSLDLEGLAVEACGTNQQGSVSLGFATQLPFSSSNPEIDVDCQENIGAYDPNDKQAWPLGTGDDHRIRPETKLEYMIRFQNTGTDTAFNIVIKDALSAHLNPATVQPGAASHPYRFNMLEGNVLQFSFDNIELPDSNVNQLGSNGFVKFSVEQMTDNPIGTEILNEAAIYFDFNEPVITNTVSRLISEEVVIVSVDDPKGPNSLPVTVFPNPFSTTTTIQVQDLNGQPGQLQLFDLHGKHLKSQKLENGQTQLNAENMTAGLYFFSITTAGKTVSRGRIVVR